jgi:hypothetical protein
MRVRAILRWVFGMLGVLLVVAAALDVALCFIFTWQPVERCYASFPLPNGDQLIIDRKDLGFDVPMAQYLCRTKSTNGNLIASSMNNEHPGFRLEGPDSGSVVAVVSTSHPDQVLALYDFRTGKFFLANGSPGKNEDDALSQFNKATGENLVFANGETNGVAAR